MRGEAAGIARLWDAPETLPLIRRCGATFPRRGKALRKEERTIQTYLEQAFGKSDVTSAKMRAALREWLDLYYGVPRPGEDAAPRLAALIVGKLCRTVFAEYETRLPPAAPEAVQRSLEALNAAARTYYSFTNAAALTVRTAEVPAVTISFAAIEDTSAIFLAQLTADAEPDDAALTLTVHYYLNDQQIENFAPQQRMEAGPHTLALFYPFANVEANTVKRLSVRLLCSGGTVRVAQYGIKATVTGQGMAGETPWNGLLECEELVAPVRLTPRTLALGPCRTAAPR